MNKFTLLFASAAFAATGASAQLNTAGSVVKRSAIDAKTEIGATGKTLVTQPKTQKPVANKTAVAGTRTYNITDDINMKYSGGIINSTNLRLPALWPDTLMITAYSDGAGGTIYSPVEVQSAYQVLDVKPERFNDPNFYTNGELAMGPNYRVDSVGLYFSYQRNAAKPNVVDTLILNFIQGAGTGKDMLSLRFVDDSTNVLAAVRFDPATIGPKATIAGNPKTFKIFLKKSTENDTIPAGNNFAGFNYLSVPVGLNMTNGDVVGMTMTFKSGDQYQNLDTLANFNRFAPMFFNEGGGTRVSVFEYDYNMSGIHWTTNDTATKWNFQGDDMYLAASMYNPGFTLQYVYMDWNLSTTNGTPVGVKNVADRITAGNAYPNPANGSVNVPFVAKQSAKNVTVTISNLMGQQVAAQSFNNVEAGKQIIANFNTANLSNGMYIYTVAADGAKVSNRFVVSK